MLYWDGATEGRGVGFIGAGRGGRLVDMVDASLATHREDAVRDRVQVIDRVCKLGSRRSTHRGRNLSMDSLGLSYIVYVNETRLSQSTLLGGEADLKQSRQVVVREDGVPAFEVLIAGRTG